MLEFGPERREKCRKRLARDPRKFVDQFTRAVIRAQDNPDLQQFIADRHAGAFGEDNQGLAVTQRACGQSGPLHLPDQAQPKAERDSEFDVQPAMSHPTRKP